VEPDCHPATGACSCRSRVRGRACDTCEPGFWGLLSGSGCEECPCDPFGSVNTVCDSVSGQCVCKPGVGGQLCDACLAGYWGMSVKGCVKCSPCERKGHVCDPDTGRCICPVLTEGEQCERCAPGAWNYDPVKGCKKCQCHSEGSVSGQCDAVTGQCRCLEGFEGGRCDKCAPGYYNFPNCRACNCNLAGTKASACTSGACQCDEQGVCPCKSRVAGKKCASCALGYFGLEAVNPEGCIQCFCFGRSRECEQAPYSWTQLGFASHSRRLTISRGDSQLAVQHGLLVIPNAVDSQEPVVIGVSKLFDVPLYWRLPDMFGGDRVLSYNGYLRFSVQTNGEKIFGQEILEAYPLVLIQGNHNIRLVHYPIKLSGSGRYEVRLHEDEWVNQRNPLVPVTRTMLMIGLQAIQQILIRATDATDATVATLHGVSLDVARPPAMGTIGIPQTRPALGVEMCSCPAQYNSTSCQDPGRGFYRYYKESYVESEIIIDLVGDSVECLCNGRADTCEPDTGFCLGCREATAGAWCDICAAGHYGDPLRGEPCQPCQCPSAEKNFAITCSVAGPKRSRGGAGAIANSAFSCQCQEGYTGPTCERCAYGYYGDPEKADGKCHPCDCNPFGSETDQCDGRSGQCYCVAGVTGRDCGQCKPRHILTHERHCKDCNDGCVGVLLGEICMEYYILNVSNCMIGISSHKTTNIYYAYVQYLHGNYTTYLNSFRNCSICMPSDCNELHMLSLSFMSYLNLSFIQMYCAFIKKILLAGCHLSVII
jgi:laminin alpha 1/2